MGSEESGSQVVRGFESHRLHSFPQYEAGGLLIPGVSPLSKKTLAALTARSSPGRRSASGHPRTTMASPLSGGQSPSGSLRAGRSRKGVCHGRHSLRRSPLEGMRVERHRHGWTQPEARDNPAKRCRCAPASLTSRAPPSESTSEVDGNPRVRVHLDGRVTR